METEANLSQEVAPTNDAEVLEEASAATVNAVDAQPSAEVATSDEAAHESNAVMDDAQESPTTEDGDASKVEEASSASEPADVIATEDVAPAQSRMNLARVAKEALIERAKELATSTDWRATSDAQRELMDEWRKTGYAGKEDNDRLWNEFRAARQEFYSRRETEVVSIKRQIIDEGRELTQNVTNWVQTSNKLDGLMARWKEAGNSGSDTDKELWEEFNGIRRDFRNRRKADLDQRRATAKANAEAKAAIIEQAKEIAASEQYTRENSDRMRQLDKDYKAIGFAGKPANDTLWEEFKAAKDSYWTANSAHMDERRRQRSERLQEVVERKNEQIEHLKTQNETLTARLGSTLDPEKLAKIQSWIAQNEERVDGLAEDVADIERKI